MNGTPASGEAGIGWPRAIVSGLAVVIVAAVAAVYGSNAVLTRLTGLSRDTREYLAAFVFLAVVVVTAWVLRRLQARGVI